MTRQRYDLDYPQSRIRFIDHDAGTVTTLGYVVTPPCGRDYWGNEIAKSRIAEEMTKPHWTVIARLKNIAW